MVSAVVGSGDRFCGLHRTFLSPFADGSVGKANVSPNKMSLGPTRRGAVRMSGTCPGSLIITEGIEDALTIFQVYCGEQTVWAALGTFNLGQLAIPSGVRGLIIAADNDEPGREAATRAGWAYQRQGFSVRIACPSVGKDWNEVLLQ
jgi:DNA primase